MTSFPEKAREETRPPRARVRRKYTKYTKKYNGQARNRYEKLHVKKKTSSVANLNWFTASLYRATPRLDFSGF